MRRSSALAGALQMVLAAMAACQAIAQSPERAASVPPDLVVVSRGLGLDALRDSSRPELRRLARDGLVALVSTPTPRPHDRITAALSLAVGRPERADSLDALLLLPDEHIEGASAHDVFRRRTGIETSVLGDEALLHLGIGPLVRRGIAGDLVGAVAERALGRPAISLLARERPDSDVRLAGLLAVTQRGLCPTRPRNGTQLEVTGAADASRALEETLAREVPRRRRIWVVPASGPDGGDRLALTVLYDTAAGPGLLTSNTTRTPGLIASFDVAPTMLAWLGVAHPRTMRGSPVRALASRDAQAVLRAMDRIVLANARAMTPVLLGLGLVLASIVFPALGLLRRRPSVARRAAQAIPILLSTPFALLVAPAALHAMGADSTSAAVAIIVMTMLITTGLCSLPRTPPGRAAESLCARIYGIAALAILVDTALGGRMIRFSLLSSFQLSGIRFYGIGNEFMGLLIGTALVSLALTRTRAPLLAIAGLTVAAVVGTPSSGANAGGAITAVAAFGMATWTSSGRRATPLSALALTVLGLAVAGVLALADAATSPSAPTHLGAAVLLTRTEGPQALLGVLQRKAHMAAGIAATWGVLLAVVGSAIFLIVAYRARRDEVAAMVARRHDWWQARHAVALGSFVALVANDSGAVPALFIFGAYFASGIYLLLWDAGYVDKEGSTGVQSSHV